MKSRKAITLISLVITIVILIILSSVAIYLSLGNDGIFTRAKQAKELTNKQTATEKINLKITTAQMNKYAEKQVMPTLKELSEVLRDDDEIQYVTEESQVASAKYDVPSENPSTIFTKLNDYPYEFEIDSSLQLASINGVKVATNNNTTGNIYSLEETKTNDIWMGKPIYIKTIYIDALPNKGTAKYAHGIENMEIGWINTTKSFMFWEKEKTVPLPLVHPNTITGQIDISLDHKDVVMSAYVDRSSYNAYVTIEYTKTTDTVN